ncbi:MAG: helix-turn-helix transcriptional regulator [Bacteroidota bacterium]
MVIGEKELLFTLGQRIKNIRQTKGLTQNVLVVRCHMDKSTLSKIENGKVNISYVTLYRICKALEVSMHEIF